MKFVIFNWFLFFRWGEFFLKKIVLGIYVVKKYFLIRGKNIKIIFFVMWVLIGILVKKKNKMYCRW